MIKAVNQSTEVRTVPQGTINHVCSQFQSVQPLTGLKLIVDIALWTELGDSGKTSPGWELYYPFSPGFYPMNLIGVGDQKKNQYVELQVISDTEFLINTQYVALADTSEGININPVDNLALFTTKSVGVNPQNVYDNTKVLSVKATVVRPANLDVAVSKHFYKNTAWKDDADFSLYVDYYTVGAKKVDGWIASKDLYVDLSVFGINVCSEWYGGIIRTNHDNSQAYWNDLRLQYAKLGETPVAAWADFEYNKITSSKGFNVSPYSGQAVGQFKIDTSYFVGGEQYQLFFIWQDVEGWHSYLTQPFGEIDGGNCLPIFPDSSQSVIYNVDNYDLAVTPNKTNYSCVNSLAPCQRFGVELNIDTASIDAELLASGYSYNFSQIYSGVGNGKLYSISIYATDTMELHSPSILDIDVIEAVATGNWKVQGFDTIPETWEGSVKYIYIVIKLSLPEGDLELIYPYSLGIKAFTDDLTLVSELPITICNDETSLTACVEGAPNGTPFKVRYNGEDIDDIGLGSADTEFAAGQACINIDLTQIKDGEDICLCVYSQEAAVDNPSEECSCGDLKINVNREVKPIGYDYTIEIDWSDIEAVLGNVYEWRIIGANFQYTNIGEITGVGSGITVNKYKMAGRWCSPSFQDHICFTFTLLLTNGCTYTVFFYPPEAGYPGSIDVITPLSGDYYYNICGVPETTSIPCSFAPWIEVVCDFVSATSTVNDDGGNVLSHEYSYDLSTWNPVVAPVGFSGNDNIYFRVEIEPPGGSAPPCLTSYYIYGRANKETCTGCTYLTPTSECDVLTITASWDLEAEELTLTESLDGSCDLVNDSGLLYSFDGITYNPYTVPIDTTGINIIYYYRNVECENGCMDSVVDMWKRECDPCGKAGAPGADGADGAPGADGADGTDGDKGGILFSFSTTTTDSDPGSGKIRYNNATIGSVTQLYLDNLDNDGNTISAWLDSMDDAGSSSDRGYLYIKGNSNTVVNVFKVTGSIVDGTGYRKVTVTYVSGSLPANNDVLAIEFCATGATGGNGSNGTNGTDGKNGGVPFTFSTTTTDSDPGNGIVRFNNATIGSVTYLYLDNLDNLGNTQTAWFDIFDDSTNTNKGHLVIRGSAPSSTICIVFQITGSVTAASGYYKVPVTYVTGSLPANSDPLSIMFSRSGDVGATGASGASPEWIRQLSDYTLTSSTSQQKLFNQTTNGACTLTTGTYFYECMINISDVGGQYFDKFSIKGAGTATIDKVVILGQNTNQLGGDYVISAGGVSDDINTFYRFTAGPCLVLITGHFRVTSGGTIIPSITLGAATAAKIKTGSYFKCVRVGADTDNASSGWS
ncbi:MAG TPA: collagen-like protein [Bacteroidia bacterium]|nr:collagen-like protein [Bacteroidia bacterium]